MCVRKLLSFLFYFQFLSCTLLAFWYIYCFSYFFLLYLGNKIERYICNISGVRDCFFYLMLLLFNGLNIIQYSWYVEMAYWFLWFLLWIKIYYWLRGRLSICLREIFKKFPAFVNPNSAPLLLAKLGALVQAAREQLLCFWHHIDNWCDGENKIGCIHWLVSATFSCCWYKWSWTGVSDGGKSLLDGSQLAHAVFKNSICSNGHS